MFHKTTALDMDGGHEPTFICEYCDRIFTAISTFYKHKNTCKLQALPKTEQECTQQSDKTSSCESIKEPCFICEHCDRVFAARSTFYKHKAKCSLEQSSEQHTHDQIAKQERLSLKEELRQELFQEFQFVFPSKQQDKHTLVYDIDLSAFASMGDDLFQALIDKQAGIQKDNSSQQNKIIIAQYIYTIVSSNSPLKLVRALYLDNVPYELRPIAVIDDTFRYLYRKGKLVSDKDGFHLAHLLQSNIQNALLKATHPLITLKLRYKDDCQESQTLLDQVLAIQTYALNIKKHLTRTDIITILKEWLAPPVGADKHPFFVNVLCPIATEHNPVSVDS